MNENNNKHDLPKGWVWTKLNSVGFVQGGYAFKSKDYKEKGIPLLRISNISNGKVTFEQDTVYLDEALSKKFIDFMLFLGDIVIALSGATTGKYGVYDLDCSALLNQRVGRIRFYNTSLVSYKYIYNYLEIIRNQILKEAYGAAQPNISTDEIAEFNYPLPPLPEQHRIVAKIEELFTKLDAGVEALKKIKAELKRYRQSVLKSAFEGKMTKEWRKKNKDKLEPATVLLEKIKEERKKTLGKKYRELLPLDTSDLLKLPQGWAWTRVGELFNISYGLSESLSKTSPDNKNDVPVIRIPNITEFGSLDLTKLKYFSLEKKQKEKLILNKGDVLFNWRNAPKWIGRSAVFNKDGEFVNASFLLKLRPFQNGYSQFMSYYLNHLRISGYFMTKVANAVNQANFNANMTSQIENPFPPIFEQQKIFEEIEQRFSVADTIEKTVEQSLKQAERLRQSILKRAFEGKLVNQDPTDEPAEKLLELIRIEKEKQASERNNIKVRLPRPQSRLTMTKKVRSNNAK